MRSIIALIAGLAVFLPMIAAECPNACSAHGKCGAYDMCLCYRNWMANDCSERICQFGLAHVDTPKGDLDASSGELSGPGTTVVLNDAVYPFGTTEQYPATLDLNGNVLTNTAHEYRECSNKGLCDRATGQCACFEGYDGSACQRASCPSNADGMCSGHGTCETIAEISARDFHNHYNLWDEDTTMGCVCDAGFTGPDCSDRVCKWGADPLYYDDEQNIRYSNWTYQFYTTTQNAKLTGNYSIVFYDAHGEDWQTAPLDWNATCEVVTAALEDIPNNVIPKDSVRCYKSETTIGSGNSNGQDASWDPIVDTSMYVYSKYTIAFPENPGKLKQITINKFLDGTRPTLYSDETTSSLGWHIYPNGFIGENTDHVADLCEDVKVSLAAATNDHYLTGLTTAEAKLLKKCLGTSDGDDTNNKDVYNWDYGDAKNPHLIKLVDATQDSSIATTDRFGDTDLDYALSKYPVSRLCSKSDAGYKTKAGGFPVDAYGINICASRNPPGFYAVLYYSETVSTTYPFRLYTRAAANYGSTTEFYVFTTTGYLQLVTPYAAAFTKSAVVTGAAKAKYHYTNTVYVSNTTTDNTIITGSPYNAVAPFGMTKQDGFLGDVSCETNPKGTYYAFDCLKKNDHVMFLNTFAATRTAADLASNPIYPNIYTVKKINRGPRFPSATGAVDANSEWRRNQIQLDYSMNSEFEFAGGFTSATDTSAAIYKFYPPQQGHSYQYAAECSNRGLCNKKSGICQCFPGFADDNCAKINALSN